MKPISDGALRVARHRKVSGLSFAVDTLRRGRSVILTSGPAHICDRNVSGRIFTTRHPPQYRVTVKEFASRFAKENQNDESHASPTLVPS